MRRRRLTDMEPHVVVEPRRLVLDLAVLEGRLDPPDLRDLLREVPEERRIDDELVLLMRRATSRASSAALVSSLERLQLIVGVVRFQQRERMSPIEHPPSRPHSARSPGKHAPEIIPVRERHPTHAVEDHGVNDPSGTPSKSAASRTATVTFVSAAYFGVWSSLSISRIPPSA